MISFVSFLHSVVPYFTPINKKKTLIETRYKLNIADTNNRKSPYITKPFVKTWGLSNHELQNRVLAKRLL